jgi:hypothetical protein
MLKESSIIHVDGLSLTVRPNVKETEGNHSLINILDYININNK